MTQKQSNDLDAEDKPYHLAMFKKGRRRNYAEFPSFASYGPIVTPDIFLANPNNNDIVLEDDESENSTNEESA